MPRVTVLFPASLYARAQHFAKRAHVSLDELVMSALAEKMSSLDAAEYLQKRAARGNRETFKKAMAKIPARKPLKGDEFPRK